MGPLPKYWHFASTKCRRGLQLAYRVYLGQAMSTNRFVEPSSVMAQWSLRLGPPLLSPHSEYQGYLGAIFTRVLKNGLPFSVIWASYIMSAASVAECGHPFAIWEGGSHGGGGGAVDLFAEMSNPSVLYT